MSEIGKSEKALFNDNIRTQRDNSKAEQLLSKCRGVIVSQCEGLIKKTQQYYCLIFFILVMVVTLVSAIYIYIDANAKKEEYDVSIQVDNLLIVITLKDTMNTNLRLSK